MTSKNSYSFWFSNITLNDIFIVYLIDNFKLNKLVNSTMKHLISNSNDKLYLKALSSSIHLTQLKRIHFLCFRNSQIEGIYLISFI